MKKLIEKHSKSPIIDRKVIFLLKDHLRCHILISPTKGFPLDMNIISSPTQITYFNITSIIKKDVLRLNNSKTYFDISMHNIMFM